MMNYQHALSDRTLSQELAHGLQELLSYEGDVEEDFSLTFQVSFRLSPSLRR